MEAPEFSPFRRSLAVTIGVKAQDFWPVTAILSEHPRALPVVSSSRFALDLVELAGLADPRLYGVALGRALFTDDLRDLFLRASAGEAPLHLMLSLDAPDLRPLNWERLCAPRGGGMEFVGLDQRVAYSRYIPSPVARGCPELGAGDLRVLVLVACPDELDRYRLAPFDAEAALAAVRAGLPGVPCTVLGPVQGAAGPSSLDALCGALTDGSHTLLHIIAHGRVTRDAEAQTLLYLSDEHNQARAVPKDELVARLGLVAGGLPQFIFFASCESGVDPGEDTMGGLARSLVGHLGIPAVLAMSSRVSVATALALSRSFYARLRVHGYVDQALVEASAELAGRRDALVPALYSRLGAIPLFNAVAEDHDAGPEPEWSHADMKVWGVALQRALARRDHLTRLGHQTEPVDTEISGIRQRMRKDGLLHAGDILCGRYLLLTLLGEGPSSAAWRAHDRETKVDVALKILHSQHTRRPELVRQFRRAVERLANLDHPGIVRPLGPVVSEQGRLFVALELMTGGTLTELVRQRRLAAQGVLPIVLQIADTLAHAHSRGLLHRDVEPSNILFDAAGAPHLGDFDMLFESDKLIDSGISHLSPGIFLAPECISGSTKASPATDVYGLAMVALFMLTGHAPTEALHVPRPFFSRLPVRPHVRRALRRAIAFDPQQRFASVEAFAAALAAPPSRRRWPWLLGSLALALVLASLALTCT